MGLLWGALFISISAFGFTTGLLFKRVLFPPTQPVRIQLDGGGSLFQFIENYSKARVAHTRYIIDGLCASACTMIVGEIPTDRVCVTPYAKLGFHAAFTRDAMGGREFSKEGTRILWMIYPPKVRDLLREHGWTSPDVDQPDLIWIEGDELLLLFKPCIEN